MDLKETNELLTMIQVTYSNSFKIEEEKKRMTANVWMGLLKDLPYNEVKQAFVAYARTHHFAPTPSDIVLFVAKIRQPEAFISGEEVWTKVAEVAQKIGYYNSEKAFEKFNSRTLRAVKAIGWERICRSEKPEFVKKEFCTYYDNMSATEQEILKLPLGFQGQYLPQYGWTKEEKQESKLFYAKEENELRVDSDPKLGMTEEEKDKLKNSFRKPRENE